MKARAIEPQDTLQLLNIHNQFYKSEFAFPELLSNKNYLIYTIADENNKVITTGILRALLEIVEITDLSRPVEMRKDALIKSLGIAQAFAVNNEFEHIHAFVQDKEWANILKRKAGFSPVKGEVLIHSAK